MLEQLEQLAERDERAAARRARRSERAPVAPESRRTPEPAPAPLSPRERRSEAAKRGWVKRRADAITRQRQTWHINPEHYEGEDGDAHETGDAVYVLYEAAHPLRGDLETIALWHSRLRPFYGRRVRVSLNGYRVDPDTGSILGRIYFTSVEDMSGYGDFFGPDSIYMRLAKRVRNASSDDELIVTSVSVELADDLPSTADLARERTKQKTEQRKTKRRARKKPRGA